MQELMIHSKGLNGKLKVPGDKSISHRSIMLGSIAEGQTRIKGFLRADDCMSTLSIMQKLGVEIYDNGEEITINGNGFTKLRPPKGVLDVGNSGTTIRLLSGLFSALPFSVTLTGDSSIQQRPMDRVMIPLKEMGADIEGQDGNYPPLKIKPVKSLKAIEYQLPVASAQVKSCVLLAGLHADGTTKVIEKEVSRDHTEQMLRRFGVEIEVDNKMITLKGGQILKGTEIQVPGDISSAAFFLGAGLIIPNSQIHLVNVGINPTRTGILDVIEAMGGDLTIKAKEGTLMGDLLVKTSELKATVIEGEIIPRLIDELPMIALLATQAKGQTIIKDAEELRVKETDRIAAVATELNKMGADITPTEDGMIINGPTPLHAADVNSYKDHRIGMMLQIAALLVKEGSVKLKDAESINISYPTFFDDVAQLS